MTVECVCACLVITWVRSVGVQGLHYMNTCIYYIYLHTCVYIHTCMDYITTPVLDGTIYPYMWYISTVYLYMYIHVCRCAHVCRHACAHRGRVWLLWGCASILCTCTSPVPCYVISLYIVTKMCVYYLHTHIWPCIIYMVECWALLYPWFM